MSAEPRRIAFLLLSTDPALRAEGQLAFVECPDGSIFMEVARLLEAEGREEALPALLAASGTRDLFLERALQKAAENIVRRVGGAATPFLLEAAGGPAAGLVSSLLAVLPADAPPRPPSDARELLASSDAELRAQGLELVSRQGTVAALGLVAQALTSDPSPEVRARAARALAWSPHFDLALETLVEALGQESAIAAQAVAEGIAALHERDHARVEAELGRVTIGAQAARARSQAVRCLGELGPAETLARLGPLSRDDGLQAAVEASVATLAQRFERPAVPLLLALATDVSASDGARAAALLAGIEWWRHANPWSDGAPGPGDPALLFLDLYDHGPAPVRAAVAQVLRTCFSQMREARQRVIARRLAARATDAEAELLAELAAQWRSPGQLVGLEGLSELRQRSPLAATPECLVEPEPLRMRLTAHDAAVRLDAVRRAARFRCRPLGASLVPLLRDPEVAVRGEAARALAALEHREAVPHLAAVLEERELWPAPEPLPPATCGGGSQPPPATEARGAILDAVATLGDDEQALDVLIRCEPWQVDAHGHRAYAGQQALPRLARRLGRRALVRLEERVRLAELMAEAGPPDPRLLEALMATGVPEALPWMRRCLQQPGRLRAAAVRELAAQGEGTDVALLLPLLQQASDRFGLDLARALEALLERDAGHCPADAMQALATFPDRVYRETFWDHHASEVVRELPLDASPLRRLAAQELARRAGHPTD